jgi:hypothetical protein
MVLPFHWSPLSPVQIDHDLNGMRYGVETPPLIAYSSKVEAIKAGIEWASFKNRSADSENSVGSSSAPMKVEQRGNTLYLKALGSSNTLVSQDTIYLYRLDPNAASEAWQQSYEGSLQYFTHGVTPYAEVTHDSLLNLIKDAGLTVAY